MISMGVISQDKNNWIDQKMSTMSLDEKIGQLFIIRAHSNLGADHIAQVKREIKDYHVGGLCFFQGSPDKQVKLTNDYQKLAKTGLLISIDGEWGLGMRFPANTISYPRQLMLGAIQDNQLIYQMGRQIGKEMKRVGIHFNYAPVVDVNNNPENPVINNRSFGENPIEVSAKAYQYMKGMQDEGIICSAKHFPGHGDTAVDSHHDLPIIEHNRARLDSVELLPFKSLIDQGVAAIMVAHLQISALDDRPNRPATLSKPIITDLLRNEMGFNGLIITDAMEMKGVTKHYKNGRAEVEAFKAGNDIILLPDNMANAINAMKEAIATGEIPQSQVDASVRRILASKYDLGLQGLQYIFNQDKVIEDVNSKEGQALQAKLVEKSLTLVRNNQSAIPITNALQKKIATIHFGSSAKSTFQKRIDSYATASHFHMLQKNLSGQAPSLLNKMSSYDQIIISIEDMSKYASKNFGLERSTVDFINAIADSGKEVILTIFGSPYSLKYFENIPQVLVAYEDNDLTQDKAAQALFGVYEIDGRLPVTASDIFPEGLGLYSPDIQVMGYAMPEEVGLSSDSLAAIDTIVAEMIKKKAAPGCQILIAKNGKIVMHKSYGHHTYNKKQKVKTDDIYDLASVTKIMASTISIMKLSEDQKLNIYYPIKKYIAEADTSNKANIIIEDMLAHHAGLAGWIPFYKHTLIPKRKKAKVDLKYYRKSVSDSFNIKVMDRLYLRTDYRDSIWSRILGSKLREKRNYRYSDLAFYIMHQSIHNVSGKPINLFADSEFYKPLGLKTAGFNPLHRFDTKRIPPTEKDNYFRGTVVDGYVHDMGAAMLGGVSGHAGLFSNSFDLAVLSQMMLNGGSYGGRQYLKPKTITQFTKRFHRSTRRGIGFDMKELNEDRKMNMSESAPASTFGHLGFTGTCVWIDPENEITYIFLSNRTYPSMTNNKFGRNEYRPRVQTVIYNALMGEKETVGSMGMN